MINKTQFENKDLIEEDKQKFILIAKNKGFSLYNILCCMDYYENLKSFEYNLNKLKEVLK